MKKLPLLLALVPAFVGCATGSGRPPPGLSDGMLQACPSSPNCICSEYPGDEEHYTTPVSTAVDANTIRLVKEVAKDMGGRLEAEQENYLAFTFRSRVFRFVDDFEVRLVPEDDLLHIRSASRVGHSDFGVNRRRVDQFKNQLQERL
ncbi:DUF1499 domain-containing protein [Gilvimarinus sp. F26214L]|uniref:DUF1499 domain-containing protein n=1 Tax=Gilvimarinus sp. DZF01 TaxID=3461371 RepID=UPI0040452D16